MKNYLLSFANLTFPILLYARVGAITEVSYEMVI